MAGPRHVVVVGASLAGLRAVEAARADGFPGRLTMVGLEALPPYDRPPLSKDLLVATQVLETPMLAGVVDLAERLDVDLRLGVPATALSVGERRLTLADGGELDFDDLVVATGSRARSLPGRSLSGVHTLRTYDDAVSIRQALDAGARTVVVGGGFIGSEVASAARKRGLPATVVEAAPHPLMRSVGAVAGEALGGLHGRYGTELVCGAGVAALVGEQRVEAVELADGRTLEADLVVVGVGSEPATAWLDGSGLSVEDGLVCDQHLRAGPGVWAAGDVARWWSLDFGRHLRVEHWTNAADQGAHAMRNLLADDPAPYRHIPYFWSDWYGHRIQFVGVPEGDPEPVSGAWGDTSFVALYRRGERVVGALTLDRRADVMKYRALVARGAEWQEAMELAAARNAARAAKASAS